MRASEVASAPTKTIYQPISNKFYLHTHKHTQTTTYMGAAHPHKCVQEQAHK